MQRNHIYGIGYTLGRNAKIRMYSIYNDTNLTKLDVHVILFPSSWQSVKSKSRLESQLTEKTLAPRFRLPRHAVLTVPAGKGKIIVVYELYCDKHAGVGEKGVYIIIIIILYALSKDSWFLAVSPQSSVTTMV